MTKGKGNKGKRASKAERSESARRGWETKKAMKESGNLYAQAIYCSKLGCKSCILRMVVYDRIDSIIIGIKALAEETENESLQSLSQVLHQVELLLAGIPAVEIALMNAMPLSTKNSTIN